MLHYHSVIIERLEKKLLSLNTRVTLDCYYR